MGNNTTIQQQNANTALTTSQSSQLIESSTTDMKQKRTKLNFFIKRSKTSGSINNKTQVQSSSPVMTLSDQSNASPPLQSTSGCFKCNLLPNGMSTTSTAKTISAQNENSGLFKKMRLRIRNNLNRFSNPEPTQPIMHANTTEVVRSQTDFNLIKIDSTENSIRNSLNDLSDQTKLDKNKKKTPYRSDSGITKSPAIFNMNSIANKDENVKISDLLEGNESISSYDDFVDNNNNVTDSKQSSKTSYTSTTSSPSSLSNVTSTSSTTNRKKSNKSSFASILSSKNEMNETCVDSICYIDEGESVMIPSSSSCSSSSESLTSLSQPTMIKLSSKFLNEVNQKLISFVNDKPRFEEEKRLFFDDLDKIKQNDNISVYNQHFYYSHSNHYCPMRNRLNCVIDTIRAPLASSETTTLSGSQTQLNTNYTVKRRIKL